MELHSVPRLSLFHAQKQIRQSPDLLCSFLRSGFTTLCVMATHRNVAVSKNLSGCFDVERIRDSNSGTVSELCQGPRGNTRPIDCSSECLLQGRTTINPTENFFPLSLFLSFINPQLGEDGCVGLFVQQPREQCGLCVGTDEDPETFVFVIVLVLGEIDQPHFPGAIDHSGCKLGEFSTSRTCMEESHDECPDEWREMWKSLLHDFPRDRPRSATGFSPATSRLQRFDRHESLEHINRNEFTRNSSPENLSGAASDRVDRVACE